MTNNLKSASFPLRASQSDDLLIRSIVIASKAWRSHPVSLPSWDCRCRFSPRNDVYFVTAQERWTTTASCAVPRIWGNLDSWI